MSARLDPFLHPVFGDIFDSQPLVVYDIGAAGKVYCPPETGPSNRVRVYGFEPVGRSYDALVAKYASNPFVECRQVVLDEQDGVAAFYELGEGQETSSSLYSRDGVDLQARAVEVGAVKLDSVPGLFGFPPADFVKLDTEGSELRILNAGVDMLDRDVLGIVCEISFWRRDSGGALFSEIDRLLTKAGFVLFDLQVNRSHISNIGGKKDKLRTGDALYLRDFSHLSERMTDTTTESKRAKLLKLVCLCVAWRYLNYALEIVDHGCRSGVISAEEFSLLSETFVSTTDLAGVVPNFPGRATVTRLVDLLSYALHRDAKKAVPEAFNALGNRWVVQRRGRRPHQVEIYKPVISEGVSRHIKVIDLGIFPGKQILRPARVVQ